MLSKDRQRSQVYLNDTTLRDGEQAPGITFSPDEKVRLAFLLDRVGVSGIEAGTPACGREEREALKRISRLGLKAEVSAWCRARKSDIQAAADCGVESVAVAISLSDIHLRYKYGRSPGWARDLFEKSIAFAQESGLKVCAALEDASRTPPGRILNLARAAKDAGASRIRLSDTVGILDPRSTGDLVGSVAGALDLDLEFHAHDDLGMATANSIAAVQAGATHLSVTALGLGERAGNAALEEVSLAVKSCLQRSTGVKLDHLPFLCDEVARITGDPIPPDKAVVGSRVFTHESGIHVDGILKHPSTYEPYPPEMVGRVRSFVLGKHSGRRSVAHIMEEARIGVSEQELEILTDRIKAGGAEENLEKMVRDVAKTLVDSVRSKTGVCR